MTLTVVCHAVDGIAPGFQQVAQFTDVAGGGRFPAKVGQGYARLCVQRHGQQFVRSPRAQKKHVSRARAVVGFAQSSWLSPECRNPPDAMSVEAGLRS